MNYDQFLQFLDAHDETMEAAYRQVYLENHETIKIKKEKTAVKNIKRIMEAVFSITYEKGFSAMTMRDLSQETGMSSGALYPYFKSKEDLLYIIYKQGMSMVKRVLEKISQKNKNPEQKLEAVIKAHIFLSELVRSWFYLMFMEAKNIASSQWETVLKAENYTEAILVDILKSGEISGVFKQQNHLMTASIIKAMQQEWYLKRWKYKKRNISVDEYAEYVIEFVRSFCIVT